MWQFDSKFEKIIQQTPTIKSFRFAREPGMDYESGQYFYVTIKVDGQDELHHFSFSSSPTDRYFIEFTKRITASGYSRALDRVKPGHWAHLEGPAGSFTLPAPPARLAFLSGGIGITPLLSMLRYMTDKKLDYNIILLFGNSTVKEIPFRQELDGMAATNPDIRVEYVLSGPDVPGDWKGRRGLIDRELIADLIPDPGERLFYVSGPPRMVRALKSQLLEMGLPDTRIKQDTFVGYLD